MDVALVRGWCGMWDVYYAVYGVLREVDEAVKFGGEDREKQWFIEWCDSVWRFYDGRMGDGGVYVRVKCRGCGLVCRYDVYVHYAR